MGMRVETKSLKLEVSGRKRSVPWHISRRADVRWIGWVDI